jgi:hypothetical protein
MVPISLNKSNRSLKQFVGRLNLLYLCNVKELKFPDNREFGISKKRNNSFL